MTYTKNEIESPAPTKTEHLVFIENDKPMTTSRLIAKTFRKQHAHVLRDIQNLNCSEKFSQSNFGLTDFKDKQGKLRPEYHITKDGFTMLAFGYTGEKAMNFKEAYIERFNFMDSELRSKPETKQIPAQAGFNEGEVYLCKLGSGHTYCVYQNGMIYTQLNALLKYFGYQKGKNKSMIERIGSNNLIKMPVGIVERTFINIQGIENILKYSQINISYVKIGTAYLDIFNIDRNANPDDPYAYHFTVYQMQEIYELIFDKPINKDKVIERLRRGKIEGGQEK